MGGDFKKELASGTLPPRAALYGTPLSRIGQVCSSIGGKKKRLYTKTLDKVIKSLIYSTKKKTKGEGRGLFVLLRQ